MYIVYIVTVKWYGMKMDVEKTQGNANVMATISTTD